MKDRKKAQEGRRNLLAGLGLVTAGAAAGIAPAVTAQELDGLGEIRRYPLDNWLDRPEVHHRIFIDSSRPLGGAEALQYANNMLNAQVNAYGGEESDFAIAVCLRRFSTPLGWGDDAWKNYGAVINRVLDYPDPSTGAAFTANPMMMVRRDLPNRGNTIQSLGERGVRFAVCEAATRVIAGVLARATSGEADAIYAELVASLVPHARFVPAGVLTATRAQEYGYSLLSAG